MAIAILMVFLSSIIRWKPLPALTQQIMFCSELSLCSSTWSNNCCKDKRCVSSRMKLQSFACWNRTATRIAVDSEAVEQQHGVSLELAWLSVLTNMCSSAVETITRIRMCVFMHARKIKECNFVGISWTQKSFLLGLRIHNFTSPWSFQNLVHGSLETFFGQLLTRSERHSVESWLLCISGDLMNEPWILELRNRVEDHRSGLPVGGENSTWQQTRYSAPRFFDWKERLTTTTVGSPHSPDSLFFGP